MKILELRFKNLTSLYGEWIIDFTHPEYVSNGIFALSGATGVGKSTVLDGICLALYGQTPRLGKIAESANEIMSRQTGECYAEVVFESQAGRFRCHWEQRRARKKMDAKLQEQEHQIMDLVTGKLIATKKSLVAGVVAEKTGMDFDQFTRSILLAQGDFDTFLRADAEQKSEILERLTGTEIYSKISRRVHEQQRAEQYKLEELQKAASGIGVLEQEQEERLRQDLDKKNIQKEELDRSLKEAEKAIKWRNDITSWQGEISSLNDETAKLQSKLEAFKPERDKLELANRAEPLEAVYEALTRLRKQQFDDQEALEKKEGQLLQQEAAADQQAKSLSGAEQRKQSTKEELKAAAPLIKEIRLLDQKIAEQFRNISEGSSGCSKAEDDIKERKSALKNEKKKRTESEETLKATEQYLQDHAQDEWLSAGLTGIEEQLGNLLKEQEEIAQKEAALNNAKVALKKSFENLSNAKEQDKVSQHKLDVVTKKIQQNKQILSNLLGDLRKAAFSREIKELEDHRAKLEDGKPCPLCGSTKHPFAEGNLLVPDESEEQIAFLTQLIAEAEKQKDATGKLEKDEAVARENLNDSDRRVVDADNDKKVAERACAAFEDDLKQLKSSFQDLQLALLKKIQPLGIAEIPKTPVLSLLDTLKSRLSRWQKKSREKTEIEKQIVAIGSEINRLNAIIDTQSRALTEKQKKLELLNREHADSCAERKKLYSDKDPDKEESRLNQAITAAEEAEKESRRRNADLQEKLIKAKADVESLKESIGKNALNLKNAETDFLEKLERAGFLNEEQFSAARLTNDKRKALSSRARELDAAQIELNAQRKEWEKRLAAELAKKVTDKTIAELKLQFDEYEKGLEILREDIANLKAKMSGNIDAQEQIVIKQKVIAAQKKECRRWKNLHDKIGSADGKKYRNFAQGLTFELMVRHANQQLEKMTDRYLLIRDQKQPLELNVVDNYQAGEIRATSNLSGGESFIVSLALALGLSKMASRKVRVDSLFIDEGFGTLDEENLEIALETLSGLRQEGKLIGIISHVSMLKERISTQIIITGSGGRSSLAGPGCHKGEYMLPATINKSGQDAR